MQGQTGLIGTFAQPRFARMISTLLSDIANAQRLLPPSGAPVSSPPVPGLRFAAAGPVKLRWRPTVDHDFLARAGHVVASVDGEQPGAEPVAAVAAWHRDRQPGLGSTTGSPGLGSPSPVVSSSGGGLPSTTISSARPGHVVASVDGEQPGAEPVAAVAAWHRDRQSRVGQHDR